MPEAVKIAAVVLNHGQGAHIEQTISALTCSEYAIDELIIVDNGSDAAVAAQLTKAFEQATVIALPENRGFAAGCNVGIRHALKSHADYVLLVNSDVKLSPDCLGNLIKAIAQADGVGIAGPTLLTTNGCDEVESTGIIFSRATGRMRHLNAGKTLGEVDPADSRRIDGISACVMLISRPVCEAIHLFDEDYFFYYEDLDFCLRANQAGFATVWVPNACAYHQGSASIGKRSPSRLYYATRNHLLTCQRQLPTNPLRRVWHLVSVSALNVTFALRRQNAPRVPAVCAVAEGVYDHLRRRYGPRRASIGTG